MGSEMLSVSTKSQPGGMLHAQELNANFGKTPLVFCLCLTTHVLTIAIMFAQ